MIVPPATQPLGPGHRPFQTRPPEIRRKQLLWLNLFARLKFYNRFLNHSHEKLDFYAGT